MNSEGVSSFDFEQHAHRASGEYQRVRNFYAAVAEVAKSLLEQCLQARDIHVLSVQARAKSVESFERKAGTPLLTDPNRPKYQNPLCEITDIAAVRVITFFPRTLEDVDLLVYEELEVIEKNDKTAELLEQGKFGYQSMHYLVRLPARRVALAEYARFKDVVFELQVRTILQHAWAEIEHDIQYKSVETMPLVIRRRFGSLAGMLEIADREFQAIQDEHARLRQVARESVSAGRLDEVEITPDAFKAYLDRTLGPDGRMSELSYLLAAENLKILGFRNFQQVSECIQGYNPDQISRAIWNTRQGQISRFEETLLAGMGENYILQHRWGTEMWFIRNTADKLDRLEEFGIEIGSYRPYLLNGKHLLLKASIARVRGRSSDAIDERVNQLIGVLQPRDAKVLIFTYGLSGGVAYSFEQIADILGIELVRTAQILHRAIFILETLAVDDVDASDEALDS